MGIADDILGKSTPTITNENTEFVAKPQSSAPVPTGGGIADSLIRDGIVERPVKYQDPETFVATQEQKNDLRFGRSRIDRLRAEASYERARDEATAAQERLSVDFQALQNGTPEEVQDWRQIAQIAVSLGATDDAEAQELKNALLWSYGEELRPHVDVLDAAWWESNYEEAPEVEDDSFLGWKSKLGAVADSGIFEYLDQWSQSALGAIGGIESALDTDDGVSAGDGIRHAIRKGAEALDVTRAVPGYGGISQYLEHSGDAPSTIRQSDGSTFSLDVDQDGTLNAREAFGIDPEAGGRLAGAIDLIGTIALDPATYVTLGASSLARVGMKSAEEVAERLSYEGAEALGRKVTREMAEEMNQRIARLGFKKGLDEAEQRWYTSLIRMANEDALAESGQATTRFGREVAEAQMSSINRGGQSGLRFAGNTFLPSGRVGEVLGRGADTFGEAASGAVRTAPAQAVDDVVDAGTDLIPARGVDARGATDNVLSQTTGELIDLPDSAIREINELASGLVDTGRFATGTAPEQLTQIVRTGVQRGVLGQLLDLAPIKSVINKLSPRARLAMIHGDSVADRLGALLSVTNNDEAISEVMVRLGADMNRGGLMRQSVDEFASHGEWERALNQSLSSIGTDAPGTFGPKTTQLLQTFRAVREEIRDVALKGGANADHMRDLDTYLPRVLSDAAKNNNDLMEQVTSVLSERLPGAVDKVQDSFMQNRTIAENLDNLFETNSEAARILREAGVTSPDKLFVTNPVAAMAARTRSAFQAAADVDLLVGITKLDGIDGISLGFRATADDAAKLTADEVAEGLVRNAGGKLVDYKKVVLDNGDVFRIHRDVARELEDVRRIFGDPRQMTDAGKFFDKLNNIWAVSATVSLVNPGFHIRNGIGNMFNAFLGGTRDAAVFTRAASIQADMANVLKGMRSSGDDFATVAARLNLDPADLKIMQDARRLGALNDGRSLDVLRETGGEAMAPSTASRLNPTNPEGFINKPGMIIGQNVENNARLGVYIDQINKGASPEAAAMHVKKTLFDYGDLTRFEQESVRRVSRFYTFMRKNTALQAYTLAHYPQRIANAEAGIDGIINTIWGSEDAGDRSLPPWMPRAAVLPIPGGQAAIGVDTPFDSTLDLMQMLTGPPTDDPLAQLGAEGYLHGLVNRSTELFSGFGPGVIDFFAEMESGRDSFTGRVLDPENQHRDTMWFGALATLLPGVSRYEGLLARNEQINSALGVRLDEEGNPIGNTSLVMQLLNGASGLQAYELSEDTDGAARYTLQSELQALMLEMEQAGIEVPTIAELREAGELAMKNRVLETLMYGWTEDAEGELVWDNEGANAQLLDILPKSVRDAFVGLGVLNANDIAALEAAGSAASKGGRVDAEEGSEEYFAQDDFDFNQALTAIETYLGRDLSDDERWTMVSAFGGALGITDQENAGFNPYRENSLLPEAEYDEAAALARKEELFNQRLASVGMTWAEALERNPRISVMQRRLEEARAAGWSDEEIRAALYYASDEGGEGWTSRADRAAINQFLTGDRNGGAVPLTLTRNPFVTDEDLQKLQTKVWQASEELRLIYAFEGWGTPTQQELFMYGVNNLTKTEQRMLGIDPLDGAQNREDIRTDEQKLADAGAKLGAVEAGLAEGPYRWDTDDQPTYAPWES